MSDIRHRSLAAQRELRQVLDRYLAGTASEADVTTLQTWLAESPDGPAQMAQLEASRKQLARGLERVEVEPFVAALDLRLRTGETVRPGVRRWSPIHMTSRLTRVAAAIVLIAAGAVAGAWLRGDVGGYGRPSATKAHEYATGPGERATVRLADGTTIMLAPATRLHVPLAYQSGDRTVSIDGEAYFTVVHNAAHPFAVRAGQALVTDIGTQFDVRAYGNHDAVQIAVSEGEASVEPIGSRMVAARPLVLRAGDVATVAGQQVVTTPGVDLYALTGWTRGQVTFTDVPLPEALAELSRWFAVDFSVSDTELIHARLTASFRDEPINDVATTLAGALGARYERAGQKITLVPIRSHP